MFFPPSEHQHLKSALWAFPISLALFGGFFAFALGAESLHLKVAIGLCFLIGLGSGIFVVGFSRFGTNHTIFVSFFLMLFIFLFQSLGNLMFFGNLKMFEPSVIISILILLDLLLLMLSSVVAYSRCHYTESSQDSILIWPRLKVSLVKHKFYRPKAKNTKQPITTTPIAIGALSVSCYGILKSFFSTPSLLILVFILCNAIAISLIFFKVGPSLGEAFKLRKIESILNIKFKPDNLDVRGL